MSEINNTGASAAGFDDLVQGEQPVNSTEATPAPAPAPASAPEPAPQSPEPQPGQPAHEEDGTTPEAGKEGGDQLFWDKFKTEDEARKSYDSAQTKIIDQGTKINELTRSIEEQESFFTILDKVISGNPDLAEQLKEAMALANGGEAPKSFKPADLEALVDRKITEKQQLEQTKKGIDDFIASHSDWTELGPKIIDTIEAEKLPFNAKIIEFVYNSLTMETRIAAEVKKAVDEALKKQDTAELERQNASAVGGGNIPANGGAPADDPFGSLVGASVNPNRV